jgi:hypothetical protein
MPYAPTASDLHVDQDLTNVSVAYFQDEADYIADKIFPAVPVEKRSDLFSKYSKSDWRRTDAEERAPGTESAAISWNVTRDSYFARVYAAHVDIPDETRANADSNWTLDSDSTRLVTTHLLLQKDQIWVNTYFKTGVWATEYTGVGASPSGSQFLQWDIAGSDPLKDVTGFKTAFRLLTGKRMSFMVLGAHVWNALVNHAAILDRIKYTQKGVVTEELVAEFFGIDKLVIAYSSEATGPKIDDAKAQDAAATYSFVANPQGVLMGYAPDRPSLLTPSAGYTFNWKGYGAGNKYGLTMRNFREERIRSDRIEGEAAYVMKQVSADCGVWLNTATSA